MVACAGALCALACAAATPTEDLPTPLLRKADPWVIRKLAGGASGEFLAVLNDKADLAAAAGLRDKAKKGRHVLESLRAVAERSQAPLLAWLTARGIEHRPFWIANMVLVRADAAVAAELAAREDIGRLAANPTVRLRELQPQDPPAGRGAGGKAAAALDAIEWGILKTRAPEAWAAGHTGQGIVIGGADTGYAWTHPALRGKYRGWNGATADHNYSWHDAIHAGGGSCGANAQQPCDDGIHGTHTMGTMVGDDGFGNQIGVAPGARWIGCRNMNQGDGTPATYAECFQWFVAPTDLGGLNPDPARAPHVVNNSWSCPESEGCTDPDVLRTVVENTRAAGIVVVVSAGNAGLSCASVSTPAAIYDAVITVGATDAADNIASFSGRGPVTVDGSNRRKPDVSAPGTDVRSSTPGDAYGTLSGTSMAGPHVAGTVALLLSAFPSLADQPSAVKTIIERTAVPRTSNETCGDIAGSSVPNNTYGWGRLDAKAAIDAYSAVPTAPLNVDGSILAPKYDALTDGLLVIRYLFGLTGPQLAAGILGATATRTEPAGIVDYLASIRDTLDVDDDGTPDALTDGLMILRFLFGLRGDALIDGAVAPDAARKFAPEIEAYLQNLMP